MFDRLLVANRGEIALRIIRACRECGVSPVAVYSEADRGSPHVRAADVAVAIGPAAPQESYLNIDALLAAARSTGAEAVHPGYGFLAESAEFARRVVDAGLTWVGPAPEVIATMGDKLAARAAVAAAGVPVIPASEIAADASSARDRAQALGYPVLVKALAGGGGKGMRAVASEDELEAAVAAASREAAAAFGNGQVYLEKQIVKPRHIEVQVLGDQHGNLVHVGERECSVQRRHQKIVEETPSPALDPAQRAALHAAGLAAARAVGYTSAGTVEFLLDGDGRFYFLEMNTRIQVEHPVSEWVSGIDIVAAQLRIAAGEPLGFSQADVLLRGHSIECRLYAEDPAAGFLPSAGRVLALRKPCGPGIRIDSGIEAGTVVPVEYDPLLGKLSVWAADRQAAMRRMIAALRETVVLGPRTNIPFLLDVLRVPAFARGDLHTGFIDEHLAGWQEPQHRLGAAAAAAASALAAAGSAASPRAAPRGAGDARDATVPSPWHTLGGWRVGSAR